MINKGTEVSAQVATIVTNLNVWALANWPTVGRLRIGVGQACRPARTAFDPICSVIASSARGRLTAKQEPIARSRSLGGAGNLFKDRSRSKVVCSMIFQTLEAAIAACIVEIDSGLDRGQCGGGSE
jgi:hypothetical protein